MPTLSPTDWRIQVKIFEKFGNALQDEGLRFVKTCAKIRTP